MNPPRVRRTLKGHFGKVGSSRKPVEALGVRKLASSLGLRVSLGGRQSAYRERQVRLERAASPSFHRSQASLNREQPRWQASDLEWADEEQNWRHYAAIRVGHDRRL